MLQQTHHMQLQRSLSFTHSKSNCGSEAYIHTALGSKLALPRRWHAEGSYGGMHCWIDLKCWKDKKKTSTLCVLDCTVPCCLPVLFLDFGPSCSCTPQGSILAFLHYGGFISGTDQYLCSYLKLFFHLKWPLSSGSTFL